MGSFYFKQFAVKQIKSAMKVNTDGVLVGAWTSIERPEESKLFKILDIGTGTGIISLILSQRVSQTGQFSVTAVEIDLLSAEEAEENFNMSPWRDSLIINKCSLAEFVINNSDKFDLIISNPPYFVKSLKSDSFRKMDTRHSDNSLSFKELAESSSKMLSSNGKLVIILPFKESRMFSIIAETFGLFLKRHCIVKTTESKEPKRVMAEYINKKPLFVKEEILVIQNSVSGDFTEEYKLLTKDFYLKF